MKEEKIKTDLIELFKLCCEKMPHNCKNFMQSSDYNVTSAIIDISKHRWDHFYKFVKDAFDLQVGLMPTAKYCSYDEYTDYPFSFYEYNSHDFKFGFEFSDKPPIIMATVKLRITAKLRRTLLKEKKFLSKEKTFWDRANFKNVISSLRTKFDNAPYKIVERDEESITISENLYFLCFGELLSEISTDEYENLLKIKEDSKLKVSADKLFERIREMRKK